MKEKDFDKIIREAIDQPTERQENWSLMSGFLDGELPRFDDNPFDQQIKHNIENYKASAEPKWSRMNEALTHAFSAEELFDNKMYVGLESISENIESQPDWSRMQSHLDKSGDNALDALVAAKVLAFSPEGASADWNKFENRLDSEIIETKEINLFDHQIKAALSALTVSSSPSWDVMNFALNSDSLLGSNSAFDGQVRDVVEESTANTTSNQWTNVKQTLDLQDKRAFGIRAIKALELAVLALAFAFGLSHIPNVADKKSEPTINKSMNFAGLDHASNQAELNPIDQDTKPSSKVGAVAETNFTENVSLAQVSKTEKAQRNSLESKVEKRFVPTSSPKDLLKEESLVHTGESVVDKETINSLPLISLSTEENLHEIALIEVLDQNVPKLVINDDVLAQNILELVLSTAVSKASWKPYVGAEFRQHFVDYQKRNLEDKFEASTEFKSYSQYGINIGLSNKKFDFSIGAHHAKLDLKNAGTESTRITRNQSTDWIYDYERSTLSKVVIPVIARVHLPVQDKFNLVVGLGASANYTYQNDEAEYLTNPQGERNPIGGPIRNIDTDEFEFNSDKFYVEPSIGVGFSYDINSRSRILVDAQLSIPFDQKSVGYIGDTWQSSSVGVSAQYFLK